VRKVIELERRKGFADEAALGGLEAFVKKHFPRLSSVVSGYGQMGRAEREKVLLELEARLEELLRGEAPLT